MGLNELAGKWPYLDDVINVIPFSAIRERKVIVKYLGNDHASHKAWMKKNLFELLAFNKMSKTKKMVEAKLYDVRILIGGQSNFFSPSRLPFRFYFCFSWPRQGGIPLRFA